MKIIILMPVVMLISSCVLAEPAALKYTVRVLDVETGIPITNAVVQSFFEHQYNPWGNKPNIIKDQKIPVDENGEAVFVGKDLDGGVGGNATAKGYYDASSGRASDGKNIVLNRWEPWNPTIEVKMRPKKNPVPMVYKKIEWTILPNLEGTIGYDLEVGDWVSPNGKGKINDLILTTSGYFQEKQRGSEARYVLTFSNENDGIQVCRFTEDGSSCFKWPYEAPPDEYEAKLERFRQWDVNGTLGKNNYSAKNKYIFRVRSRHLENGSSSGCYGMLDGELELIPQGKVKFEYYFNPTLAERSLEWNGVNLLKKK